MRQSAVAGNVITEGVIWRQLLVFFFPILFGTFFQQLYNTADAIIVGKYVGAEALAAVGGSTSVLINLLVNLLVGLSSGTTIVVAQHFGAQRLTEVYDTVRASFALAVVGGAAMGVLGFAIAPWALRAMSTPPEIIESSALYLRVYFLGMIPSFVYNMGAGVLRAVGDTRRPLYFLIVACLTNIVLDLLFVVTFELGVLGVALATLASQFVAAGLVVLALMKTSYPLTLVPKQVRLLPGVLWQVVRVGLPAGIQADMYSVSNMFIQSSINLFGLSTVAAWTAFGKIDGFFWMVLSAYGVSIMTFVGQNFGAQKYPRIRKGVRVCMLMAFVTSAVFSLLLCLFAPQLFRVFLSDSSVIAIGVRMLYRMSPFYFAYVVVEILAGAVRGTGNALIPMLITCFGVCVLRVLWVTFVLPLDTRLETLLFSYPLTWTVTSLLFLIYYLHGGWLRGRIPKSTPEE